MEWLRKALALAFVIAPFAWFASIVGVVPMMKVAGGLLLGMVMIFGFFWGLITLFECLPEGGDE